MKVEDPADLCWKALHLPVSSSTARKPSSQPIGSTPKRRRPLHGGPSREGEGDRKYWLELSVYHRRVLPLQEITVNPYRNGPGWPDWTYLDTSLHQMCISQVFPPSLWLVISSSVFLKRRRFKFWIKSAFHGLGFWWHIRKLDQTQRSPKVFSVFFLDLL